MSIRRSSDGAGGSRIVQAGLIGALLAEVQGSGSLVECRNVVCSPGSRQRLVGVSPRTIESLHPEQIPTRTSLEASMENGRFGYTLADQEAQFFSFGG
ncbi:hypothetical protein D3C78_808650 [compost metagenome]